MLSVTTLPVADYEQVVVGRDAQSGLHAVIAIHRTVEGASLGGIRMWPYADEATAVTDALRLARAMTRKATIAGLPIGGGKAVVIGDPIHHKSPHLLLALGEFIETLGGKYIGGEDLGINPADLDIILTRTRHIVGASPDKGGSGDPSPSTAQGVLMGMQAAIEHRLGRQGVDEFRGLRVAVQGLGKVGSRLAEALAQRGAVLTVTDLDSSRCAAAVQRLGASAVPPDDIYRAAVDVFSPCAMGGILNRQTIPQLQAAIVAGSANNQFQDEQHDPPALARRGILHAPDYVINAGGLMHVYLLEVGGIEDIHPWLAKIPRTLKTIFDRCSNTQTPPQYIANHLADTPRHAHLQHGKV